MTSLLPPEPTTILKSVMRAEATQLLSAFADQTKLIKHRGERGVARELLLRDFLRKHLPARFGIGRGQVIDHHGRVSGQQDIVVFDALRTPFIDRFEAHQTFPRESVLLLVEVKSAVTAPEVRAFVDRVAEMSQDPGALVTYPTAMPVATREDRYSLHGVLFSFGAKASIPSIAEALYEANLRHPFPPLVGSVCVLDRGFVHFQPPSRVGVARPWGEQDEPVYYRATDTPLDHLALFFANVYGITSAGVAQREQRPEVVTDVYQYLQVRADHGVFTEKELAEVRDRVLGTASPKLTS